MSDIFFYLLPRGYKKLNNNIHIPAPETDISPPLDVHPGAHLAPMLSKRTNVSGLHAI